MPGASSLHTEFTLKHHGFLLNYPRLSGTSTALLLPPCFSFREFASMRLYLSRFIRPVIVAALATLACSACPCSVNPASPAGKPRLAVLLVFDQMRGDYLTRWESLFVDNGFRRLMKDGAWFQN